MPNSNVKVLSCVPRQLGNTKAKLSWLRTVCEKHNPDILVTPQEFFGGAVIMPDQKQFTQAELYPKIQKISREYNCAFVISLVELFEDGLNREVIWFIEKGGELRGKQSKFALPRYDHISTNGSGDIIPETNFMNRFQTFEISGITVAGIFCWEVYSDILWTGLGLLKPDLVFSLIKFGVNAWPKVRKQNGKNTVIDFGYGSWSEDGGWIDRLRMANVWQVKCPIICSTNSWNLRPISMPLCGCISGIDGQAENTLWHPTKQDKLKKIPEKIIVDYINPSAVQAALQNKFIYKDVIGNFPPFSIGRFTMMLKINRIEDRILSGREDKTVGKSVAKVKGGFGLLY